MKKSLTILLFATATVGSAGAQTPDCDILGIEYDVAEEQSGSGFLPEYQVVITIKTSPSDEQRSLNGNGLLYYRYLDREGRLQKSTSMFNFFDSVPAGQEDSDIYHVLTAIGPLDKVYDMKMFQLNCSID